MTRIPTGARVLSLPLALFLAALAASCGDDSARVSPTTPATPEAALWPPQSDAAVSPTTSPDRRSVAEAPAVPAYASQGVSEADPLATRQLEWSAGGVFREALDELLDDLPVAIEDAVLSGQSETYLKASLVPGVVGIVGRLAGLANDAYVSERSETGAFSPSSVPCNECSDNLTHCLDDALDNFVDCVFECGTFDGDCRRACKDAWRAGKSECFDTHRECVKTCTPK